MHTADPFTTQRLTDVMPDLSATANLAQGARLPTGISTPTNAGEFSLTDSAEEITLHMAHRVEDKLHSERKIRGERPLINIEIETLLSYLDQAREDDAQARLEELASHILSGKGDARTEISNFASRMSVQYLAYHYVLQRGRQQNAPEEILSDLSDALAELEQRAGQSIRGDINTIDAAAAYGGQSASDIARFQATYENVVRLEASRTATGAVLGDATLARTLSLALSSFGGKKIAEGLKALTSALGLDLAAAQSSTSKTWLHALLSNMFHVEAAVTVLNNCRDLGARLTEVPREAFDEDRLMQKIVNVVDGKWVSPTIFSSMATDFGVASLPGRIAFLDGMRSILKDLPVQLFPSDEARTDVLQAVQFAFDAAAEEEFS